MSDRTLALLAQFPWLPAMILAAAVVASTRTLRYRLAWAAACFVGVGAFWMQLETRRCGFIPIAVNLLGPGHAPGLLKATIPIGAIVALTLAWRSRTAPGGS